MLAIGPIGQREAGSADSWFGLGLIGLGFTIVSAALIVALFNKRVMSMFRLHWGKGRGIPMSRLSIFWLLLICLYMSAMWIMAVVGFFVGFEPQSIFPYWMLFVWFALDILCWAYDVRRSR
jgi:hypothetical protein